MTLQSAYVSIKNSLMASYANTYREEVGYWLQNLIAAVRFNSPDFMRSPASTKLKIQNST